MDVGRLGDGVIVALALFEMVLLTVPAVSGTLELLKGGAEVPVDNGGDNVMLALGSGIVAFGAGEEGTPVDRGTVELTGDEDAVTLAEEGGMPVEGGGTAVELELVKAGGGRLESGGEMPVDNGGGAPVDSGILGETAVTVAVTFGKLKVGIAVALAGGGKSESD